MSDNKALEDIADEMRRIGASLRSTMSTAEIKQATDRLTKLNAQYETLLGDDRQHVGAH